MYSIGMKHRSSGSGPTTAAKDFLSVVFNRVTIYLLRLYLRAIIKILANDRHLKRYSNTVSYNFVIINF